ncbi:choice-of-anchor M domain-containing protein, partial [Verrucomicrobiales bacterium]|nr:choice-of-anchor M domain-containing protein [Verrucomicrobiales bacterium]
MSLFLFSVCLCGAVLSMTMAPAAAQGPRLTQKNGLEDPIEKGHIDLTYIYADGKWEIFLQLDEDKLLPLEDAVNGVPSLVPGDNVMVAADHEFPNGSRIERAEGAEWDFLGVGPNEPLWFIPQSNWNCVWPGMVVRGPFARYFEDDPRINATDDWVAFRLRDVRFTGISDEGEYTTSEDGHFSTWNTSGIRGTTPWMVSSDGIDDRDAFFLSGTLSHAHFTWGFSRRGIYEIDLQATAIDRFTGEPIESDMATYHWAVGAYPQWLADHFSTRTLIDPLMSGPEADPDGDGQSNLHEYAFDSNPRIANGLITIDEGDETIVEETGLMRRWKSARAISIKNIRKGYRIQTEANEQIEARNVVLALGTGDQPNWPKWATQLRAQNRQAKVHHIFSTDFKRHQIDEEHDVAIVGAGISAAQLALSLLEVNPNRQITLLSRHFLRKEDFDSDPGWLGPTLLTGFHREKDYSKR